MIFFFFFKTKSKDDLVELIINLLFSWLPTFVCLLLQTQIFNPNTTSFHLTERALLQDCTQSYVVLAYQCYSCSKNFMTIPFIFDQMCASLKTATKGSLMYLIYYAAIIYCTSFKQVTNCIKQFYYYE